MMKIMMAVAHGTNGHLCIAGGGNWEELIDAERGCCAERTGCAFD